MKIMNGNNGSFQIPLEVLKDILSSGLIIIGNKKCGKSNAGKVILHQFIQKQKDFPNLKVKIFDTVFNWRYSFTSIPYILVNENNDTEEFLHKIALANSHLIVDVDYLYSDEAQEIIGEILEYDYLHKKQLKIANQGKITEYSLYLIEEAQNIIGTYALMRDVGKFWLKMVSEGRNMGINFIFIGQRAGDISPKAVERSQNYLIGRTLGDNNKRKVKSIAGKDVMERAEKLKVGEFIFYNGLHTYFVRFPLFKSNSKPYPYQYKPDNKPIWKLIK